MKKILSLIVGAAVTLAPQSAFGATAEELMRVGMPAAQAVLLSQEAISSDMIPDTDGTYDLGSSTKEWQDLYIDGTANIDTASVGAFSADVLPNADGTLDLGASGTEFQDLFIDGTAYIDTYSPISGMTFTAQAANWFEFQTSTENARFDFVDDDTTWSLGMFTSDDKFSLRDQTNTAIIFEADGSPATLTVGADLVPRTDGANDLGSASLEWQDLYIDGTAYIDAVEAGADKPGSDVAASGLFSWTDVSTTVQAILLQATNDANAPLLYLNKTRATDGTANTVVNNDDTLGRIIFLGADGASYQEAAWIQAKVNGTPGSGDMPAELSFAVTPDGAASAVEAFRIEEDGDAFLLGPTVTTSGQIISTGTSDLGWSVQSAANQACTTTCTYAAVFGFDTGTTAIVGPSDATADTCVCAGAS